jgi:hypothetical protein
VRFGGGVVGLKEIGEGSGTISLISGVGRGRLSLENWGEIDTQEVRNQFEAIHSKN